MAAALAEVCGLVERCLGGLGDRPQAKATTGVDAPSAVEPPAAVFATRGLDCLLALAEAARAPDAPKQRILDCLRTAKTTLVHHLNPIQRRKLQTVASTLKATAG